MTKMKKKEKIPVIKIYLYKFMNYFYKIRKHTKIHYNIKYYGI